MISHTHTHSRTQTHTRAQRLAPALTLALSAVALPEVRGRLDAVCVVRTQAQVQAKGKASAKAQAMLGLKEDNGDGALGASRVLGRTEVVRGSQNPVWRTQVTVNAPRFGFKPSQLLDCVLYHCKDDSSDVSRMVQVGQHTYRLNMKHPHTRARTHPHAHTHAHAQVGVATCTLEQLANSRGDKALVLSVIHPKTGAVVKSARLSVTVWAHGEERPEAPHTEQSEREAVIAYLVEERCGLLGGLDDGSVRVEQEALTALVRGCGGLRKCLEQLAKLNQVIILFSIIILIITCTCTQVPEIELRTHSTAFNDQVGRRFRKVRDLLPAVQASMASGVYVSEHDRLEVRQHMESAPFQACAVLLNGNCISLVLNWRYSPLIFLITTVATEVRFAETRVRPPFISQALLLSTKRKDGYGHVADSVAEAVVEASGGGVASIRLVSLCCHYIRVLKINEQPRFIAEVPIHRWLLSPHSHLLDFETAMHRFQSAADVPDAIRVAVETKSHVAPKDRQALVSFLSSPGGEL